MFRRLVEKVSGKNIVIVIMVLSIIEGILSIFSTANPFSVVIYVVAAVLMYKGLPYARWILAFGHGVTVFSGILVVAYAIGDSDVTAIQLGAAIFLIILSGFLAWTLVYNKKVEDFLYDQQIENKW